MVAAWHQRKPDTNMAKLPDFSVCEQSEMTRRYCQLLRQNAKNHKCDRRRKRFTMLRRISPTTDDASCC